MRAREIDSIKIGKCVEHCIHFIPMDVAKFCDFLIGIGIYDFRGPAVVTEERHIRHGGGDIRIRPAAAMVMPPPASRQSPRFEQDPPRIGACRVDGADRIGEDTAVVVMPRVKDSLGHAAREMRIAAICIEIGCIACGPGAALPRVSMTR